MERNCNLGVVIFQIFKLNLTVYITFIIVLLYYNVQSRKLNIQERLMSRSGLVKAVNNNNVVILMCRRNIQGNLERERRRICISLKPYYDTCKSLNGINKVGKLESSLEVGIYLGLQPIGKFGTLNKQMIETFLSLPLCP